MTGTHCPCLWPDMQAEKKKTLKRSLCSSLAGCSRTWPALELLGAKRGMMVRKMWCQGRIYIERRGEERRLERSGKTSDSQNDDDDDDGDESSNLKSQCPKLHKYSHSSPSFPISDIVCLETHYYAIFNFSTLFRPGVNICPDVIPS